MKNFLYQIGISVGILSILSACHFLEVEPIGKNTIGVFFSDMEGIEAALPGAYSAVYDYYQSEFGKYPDVAGNMLRLKSVASGGDMLDQYNFTSDTEQETGAVGYIWRKILVALANVNNILEYEPDLRSKFPQRIHDLKRYRAEALFLRALCHFDLCRVYAQPYNYTTDASHLGIPVLLKVPGADENVRRNTVREVYTQILEDLKEAEMLFSEAGARGGIYYASLESVEALRMRVCLYMEDYGGVITNATQLIEKIPLSRGRNYTDMYYNLLPGDESIFRLSGWNKASKLASFYDPASPVAIPADTLISMFDDPADLRLDLLQSDTLGGIVCLKYYILTKVAEKDKHYDPMVFRVSEAWLSRAEAYLCQGNLTGAAADLREIIARALEKETSEIDIPSGKTEIGELIRKERAKELCFEGHGIWDITRQKQDLVRESNTNSTVRYLAYPNTLFVLPIPQKELDANPNMQPNPYFKIDDL